jgi:hypothetical protein
MCYKLPGRQDVVDCNLLNRVGHFESLGLYETCKKVLTDFKKKDYVNNFHYNSHIWKHLEAICDAIHTHYKKYL